MIANFLSFAIRLPTSQGNLYEPFPRKPWFTFWRLQARGLRRRRGLSATVLWDNLLCGDGMTFDGRSLESYSLLPALKLAKWSCQLFVLWGQRLWLLTGWDFVAWDASPSAAEWTCEDWPPKRYSPPQLRITMWRPLQGKVLQVCYTYCRYAIRESNIRM